MCEVCYEPLFDEEQLSPEIREKIYRPERDGKVEEFELELQEREAPLRDEGWGMVPERNGD